MTITKFKQEDKLLTFILILNLLILLILFCPEITAAEPAPEDSSINNYQTPQLTTGVIVVGLIILMVLILLIWEPLPAGLISLSIPVSLVVFKSWTNVSTEEALSGFSNKATITVMSMFVLGKGIQNSGAVQFIGKRIEKITGDNIKKQVGVISWITGSIASIINNTPVVAAFIPMVTNIAHRTRVSPSKLLIPLSYAAMLGGTITLFGTSTNILASQISERLIDHPFSMFEFSKLGLIVLTTGTLYLITFGYYLLPDRIIPRDDIIKEYQLQDYLVEIEILSDSILIGKNVEDIISENKKDIDIIKIIRDKEEFMQPLKIKTIRKGDHLIISAKPNKLMKFKENKEIKLLKEKKITQDRLEYPEKGQEVIEIVVSNDSFIENQTIDEVNFLERYNTSLLAIRHGEELIYERLFDTPLKAGDVLLLLVNKTTLERLKKNINLIIEERRIENNFDIPKILLAFGIIGSVIFLASLKIISIAIAALGGVVAMIVTGVVESHKVYDVINWEVFFLLSGLIPLGIAVENSGTAQYLASHILNLSVYLSPVVLLALFYFITSFIAAGIGNNASVVLMLPVSVKAALQLGLNPFAFVLAVTFAASGSFISPIGYQTNLMVYGPGGYRFTDYFKLGFPLQLILTIIVPFFITIFWGL